MIIISFLMFQRKHITPTDKVNELIRSRSDQFPIAATWSAINCTYLVCRSDMPYTDSSSNFYWKNQWTIFLTEVLLFLNSFSFIWSSEYMHLVLEMPLPSFFHTQDRVFSDFHLHQLSLSELWVLREYELTCTQDFSMYSKTCLKWLLKNRQNKRS